MRPSLRVAAFAAATMLAGSSASWAGQLDFVERVVDGPAGSHPETLAEPETPVTLDAPAARTAPENAADLPLVIAVHGLGDRPESFIRLFDELEIPARIIAPRAPIAWGSGFSWFPLPGTGQASHEAFVEGLRDSARSLAELATALAREHRSLRPPVIVGFSQGGMLSFAVAALYPEAIRASLPVAGLLPDALDPIESSDAESNGPSEVGAKLPTVIAFHGDADSRVPEARAALAVERLRDAGYDARLQSYPGVGHSIPASMRRDLLAAIAAAVGEKPSAPASGIRAGDD